VWEDVVDGSEGDHDQGEGGAGGVEAVGPVDDQADAPVESFVAGVRSHRQLHALAMIWVKWPGCG
jgi:hypothetical protein